MAEPAARPPGKGAPTASEAMRPPPPPESVSSSTLTFNSATPQGDGPHNHVEALQARLLSNVSWVVAVGALGIWLSDLNEGWVTPWERYGAPVMALIYAVAAMALRCCPQHVNKWIFGALGSTSVYFLGCLYFSALDHGVVGLYSVASNAQFMPLLYVGAFVSMRTGAAWLSWAHYAGVALIYWKLYSNGVHPSPNDFQAMSAHTLMAALATHPAYILALHFIIALKGRVRAAEHKAHHGKERFLAMLSHEIRTPLQAMLASIDLLALKLRGPTERRAVDRLRLAATQLESHLRDVTEFTRLEDPAWQVHTQPIDLTQLVVQTCERYRDQAEAKNLALTHELMGTAEQLQAIDADATRLQQLLSNLISNALKYTLKGEVHVKAGFWGDAAALPATTMLRLQVHDTGIGIPSDALSTIFQPYVRLEDARALQAEGSGLGLAVVKRLVDRLGGQLVVDSQPGQGSRFEIRLPMPPRPGATRQ